MEERNMQARLKISRGIFESHGTNQRSSTNYPAMSPPGSLSFSEVTQFGEKTTGVCICVCLSCPSEGEPNQ